MEKVNLFGPMAKFMRAIMSKERGMAMESIYSKMAVFMKEVG